MQLSLTQLSKGSCNIKQVIMSAHKEHARRLLAWLVK